MMFDLPDPETLYHALLARDARFDGQVFVCVATTGIFCRVIGADGSLTGYGGGLWRKQRLIEIERAYRDGKA